MSNNVLRFAPCFTAIFLLYFYFFHFNISTVVREREKLLLLKQHIVIWLCLSVFNLIAL